MPGPLPPPPPAVHRPAPASKPAKNAENYAQTQGTYKRRNPPAPRAAVAAYPFDSIPFYAGKGRSTKHTNRLKARKQAKLRAKRKAA